MSSNQEQITGENFAEFASADPLLWSRIERATLHHSDFGVGIIENVEQREKYIPLIRIKFDGGNGTGIYNSESFRNGKFTICISEWLFKYAIEWHLEKCLKKAKETERIHAEKIEVQRVETERLQILAEEQAQRAKIDALQKEELQRISKLAARHSVPLHLCWDGEYATPIALILEKLESKQFPSLAEMSLLEENKLFKLIARINFIQYKINGNIWLLVKACSFLRIEKMPEMAIKISTNASNLNKIKDKRALSALWTSRGGAFRDISELDSARESAETAIQFSPGSYHPYNLMGAICYQQGLPADGDKYFSEAIRLGSISRNQDKEIRTSFEKATLEAKKVVAQHLIAKDASRYSWVKEHINIDSTPNPDHEYELHQIHLDMQETKENLARSEDEGWYYDDN